MSMTHADRFYGDNVDSVIEKISDSNGDFEKSDFDREMDNLKDEEINKLWEQTQKYSGKFETPPIVFLLEEKIKYQQSYILNFMDNWNYLRDVLSSVKEQESRDDADHQEECDEMLFTEAKEFSEAFAMNTFREWFNKINKDNKIESLDDHENFKNLFWKSTPHN